MKKYIWILSIGLMIAILLNLFFTENINSIEGDFEELAFVRNENNTGPIKRLYAYSLNDTLWENMREHADLLPHNKYGSTEVYYFVDQSNTQAINLNLTDSRASKFDKTACVAYLRKDGMGNIKFEKYPFTTSNTASQAMQ